MYKIALRGMRGRRRDTLLLMLVVTLSFTLLITTVLLHGSTQYTGQLQRMDAFGEWTAGIFGLTEEERQQVQGEYARLRLLGTSEQLGLIGAADDALLEMGHFSVEEGRLPEAKDEIAIESGRLATYGNDLKVGDRILVVTSVPLHQMSQSEINQEIARLRAADPEALRLQEECRKQYPAEVFSQEDGRYVYYRIWDSGNYDAPVVVTEDIAGVILEVDGVLRERLTEEAVAAGQEQVDYYRYYWSALRRGYEKVYYEEYDNLIKAIVADYLERSYAWVTRTEYSGEGLDEMRSRTRSEFVGPLNYAGQKVKGMEGFLSIAVLTKQVMELKREMTICGILTDYSSDWDTGTYEMPSALVTAETGQAFLEEGLYQLEPIMEAGYQVPQYLFFRSDSGIQQESSAAQKLAEQWGERFRFNVSAYPDGSESTEQVLAYSILGFILIATVFSVFQIFLIQMKRRVRRLALLKAIGTTNRQVAELLLWEGLFLLIPGLLLGAVISVGVTVAAKALMPVYTGAELLIYCDVKLLSLGMLGGCLAVLLGMSVPGAMALHVPLTGSIQLQASNRHGKKNRSTREILKQKSGQYQIQHIHAVERRHRKYTRGQNRMLQALYSILISVLLGSLLLGFLAFYDHTRQVVLSDRPEYELQQSYSLRKETTLELEQTLSAIPGVERVELWREGNGTYLWFDGIAESGQIRMFRELLPESLRSVHFYDAEEYKNLAEPKHVEEALKTGLYAVAADSALYERLTGAVTEGGLNPEKYILGEQVIVMVPLSYEGSKHGTERERYTMQDMPGGTVREDRMSELLAAAGQYELTYSDLYKEYYAAEDLLQPGMDLVLTVPTEEVNPESGARTNEVRQKTVKVGAVIHYFPEKGIWPFAGREEAYAVIGSDLLYYMLYPHVESDFGEKDDKGDLTITAMELATHQRLHPTRYGEMNGSIYIEEEADIAYVEMEIRSALSGYLFKLDRMYVDSTRIYNRALKQASMAALVAFAAVLIILVVLYNMRISRVEQERERMGILQSLGVTGRQLRWSAARESLSYGLWGLLAAHLVVLVILLATSTVQIAGVALSGVDFLRYILTDRLYGYPWMAHGAICAGYLIVVYLIQCMPLRKYEKCQPVENIRSQGH